MLRGIEERNAGALSKCDYEGVSDRSRGEWMACGLMEGKAKGSGVS